MNTTIAVRIAPSRGPDANGEKGVFAARDLITGEHIGTFAGTESATRTRMSLQFGPEQHIEPGETDPLRYLNHACEPNTVFHNRELTARVAIAADAEITIDYNCHEPELASPFACRCGADECVGMVRGARHLTEAQHRARYGRLQAWLIEKGERGEMGETR